MTTWMVTRPRTSWRPSTTATTTWMAKTATTPCWAAAMGLVNAVVAPDELLPYTLKYAANLARTVSPTSMAVIKRQVYNDWDKDLFTAHADSVQLMKESLRRPDFREGVASYLEKRPPQFGAIDPNA